MMACVVFIKEINPKIHVPLYIIYVFMQKLQISNVIRTGLLLLVLLLPLTGCKKGNEPEDSTLILRIIPVAGGQKLDYQTSYAFKGGFVRFVGVRYYVSLPGVVKENGDTLLFDDVYALLDPENTDKVIGKIPAGLYAGLTFGMGVDYERNTQLGSKAQPATQYPMDHPLSAANGMYWGWNPGYIFARFDGRFDANGNGSFTDPEDVNFTYHPGTDKLYRTLWRPVLFKARGGQLILSLTLDVLKCLEPIDIPAHPASHPVSASDPEYPTAQALVNQYESAFSGVTVQ